MPVRACVTSACSTLRRAARGVTDDWPAEENQRVCGSSCSSRAGCAGGVAKLEAQLDGGQLGRRPREKSCNCRLSRMQGAGATKGAADFVTRDRLEACVSTPLRYLYQNCSKSLSIKYSDPKGFYSERKQTPELV